MRRQTQVAERERLELQRQQIAQRIRVAGRLGHFQAVGQQVLAVQPDPRERPHAGERLALGALVLVVRENVVDAAGVDVYLWTEVLGAHGGALDVPAREAPAPRAGPDQLGSARLRGLPERKVARILFQRSASARTP